MFQDLVIIFVALGVGAFLGMLIMAVLASGAREDAIHCAVQAEREQCLQRLSSAPIHRYGGVDLIVRHRALKLAYAPCRDCAGSLTGGECPCFPAFTGERS